MSIINEFVQLHRVYRRVRARDIATLWVRRMKLYGAPLVRSIVPGRDEPRRPRLIISLSTIPSRIDRIRPVLNSLLDQDTPADSIVLALPRFSRREQRPYVVPAYLSSSEAITVLRCEDWGPATKLIPTLLAEKDPGTLLLIVDDDVIYPPDFVSTFRRWHERYPDSALGYRGWSMPASLRWSEAQPQYATNQTTSREVDVITGVWGVLVQPRFFDSQLWNYGASSPEAFYVDDIWINGHLARRSIPRMLIPARLPPMSTLIGRRNGLIFGENRDGRNNDVVIRDFSRHWHCNRTRNPVAAT